MEKTFVAIKPDGVQRGLIGKVIFRFEDKGFKLVGMKFIKVSPELAARHYSEHKEKPFFNGLVSFITSSPVVVMVWEGKNIVDTSRKIVGKTNPQEADVGTIRSDYGIEIGKNIVHASDSIESAKREISIFFKEEEIVNWKQERENWIYE